MARVTDQQSYWGAFASTGLYKKNQGRLTRQLTGLALAVLLLFGCWTMTQTLLSSPPDFLLPEAVATQAGEELPPENVWEKNWSSIRFGVPALLAAVGVWGIYRLLNYPRFTDFLISVEAEMDKVSWPDQGYLYRATGVVLGTMLVLGVYLFACDVLWRVLFRAIGFLRL